MSAGSAAVHEASYLLRQVVPLLAGMSEAGRSVGLAQIVALYLATFPAHKRDRWLSIHVESVKQLIPIMINEME